MTAPQTDAIADPQSIIAALQQRLDAALAREAALAEELARRNPVRQSIVHVLHEWTIPLERAHMPVQTDQPRFRASSNCKQRHLMVGRWTARAGYTDLFFRTATRMTRDWPARSRATMSSR